MASVKTFNTIFIFDVATVDIAIAEFPSSYKYILEYITFGDAGSYTWNKDDGSTEIINFSPFSIYAFLIEGKKLKNVVRTKVHDYELRIPDTIPELGGAEINTEEGDSIFISHFLGNDAIYTVVFASNRAPGTDIVILGDDVNDANKILAIGDEYTVVIQIHEKSDVQQLPSRYLISYVDGLNMSNFFIDYIAVTPSVDIIYELLLILAPSVFFDPRFEQRGLDDIIVNG